MKKILIVGAGLSGLLSAYLISNYMDSHVTILEQGDSYAQRLRSDVPNIVAGVGGAGTLGGGKLCLPPASFGVWRRTGFSPSQFILFEEICLKPFNVSTENRSKATNKLHNNLSEAIFEKQYESVLLSKPQMEDLLNNIICSLGKTGVQIKTNCQFKTLKHFAKKPYAIFQHDQIEEIEYYDIVLFATGRSSAQQIADYVPYSLSSAQSSDMGIRLSLDLSENPFFHQIGKDIKLKATFKDIGVRTFCVCSGGTGSIIDLNGMKYYDGHFGNEITSVSNIGILARSPRYRGFWYAQKYCMELEKYIASDMSLNDFIKYNKILLPQDSIFTEIFESIVYFVNLLKSNGLIAGSLSNYPVFLPAVDHLNSLIYTNEFFQTRIKEIYVIGDAMGASRGFIQAMWSAFCASSNIISNELQDQFYGQSVNRMNLDKQVVLSGG